MKNEQQLPFEDVARKLETLIEVVDKNDELGHSEKLEFIATLRALRQQIDDRDPIFVNLEEATSQASNCHTADEFIEIKQEIEKLVKQRQIVPSFNEVAHQLIRRPGLYLSFYVCFWLLLGLIPIILVNLPESWSISDWKSTAAAGTIGDAFGMANAFFSGLGLLVVAFTVFLQIKELSLQRHELRMTRNELRRSTESQLEQVSLLSEQFKLDRQSNTINVVSHCTDRYSKIMEELHRVEKGENKGLDYWWYRYCDLQTEQFYYFIKSLLDPDVYEMWIQELASVYNLSPFSEDVDTSTRCEKHKEYRHKVVSHEKEMNEFFDKLEEYSGIENVSDRHQLVHALLEDFKKRRLRQES